MTADKSVSEVSLADVAILPPGEASSRRDIADLNGRNGVFLDALRDSDSMSDMDRLMRQSAQWLEEAADRSPDWFAYFEDVQAFSAPKSDLMELLRTAPTPFARGLIYGIVLMRQELAVVTGRDFI